MEQHRIVRTEYEALRGLYCSLAMIDAMSEGVKRRMKLTKGGWRYLKISAGMLLKALLACEQTIPMEDRRKLKRDLNNTEMYMRTKGAAQYSVDDEDLIYLTRNQAKTLISYVMEGCMLCDKRGKDIKACKRRKAIDATLNFAVPQSNDAGECIWAGYQTSTEDVKAQAEHATWEDIEKEAEYEANPA